MSGNLEEEQDEVIKGIRILSDINFKLFLFIIVFIFLVGPTSYILNLGTESFGYYLTHFFEKSLFTDAAANDQWPQWWTTFYWANWFSWAALTALFLGRIAYGHTVRAFIILRRKFVPSIELCCLCCSVSGFPNMSKNSRPLRQLRESQGLLPSTKKAASSRYSFSLTMTLPLLFFHANSAAYINFMH